MLSPHTDQHKQDINDPKVGRRINKLGMGKNTYKRFSQVVAKGHISTKSQSRTFNKSIHKSIKANHGIGTLTAESMVG